MGKKTFFSLQSQIWKFSGSFAIANPQIPEVCQSANLRSAIFILNPQIRKFLQKNLKSRLFKKKRKNMYLLTSWKFRSAGKLESASQKITNPQIWQQRLDRKSPKCHICGRSANLTNCKLSKSANLRNLFTDRLPLMNIHILFQWQWSVTTEEKFPTAEQSLERVLYPPFLFLPSCFSTEYIILTVP